MIKLGLIGNGFVGGAARQLECQQNSVCVYDLDPEKCMPKGTTLETVAACDLISDEKTHSSAMAWVGQITLETYVLQFHVFMCRNVQHIIVFLPGFPVLNCLITGSLFVGLSWMAREATIEIQKLVRFSKYQSLPQVADDQPTKLLK